MKGISKKDFKLLSLLVLVLVLVSLVYLFQKRILQENFDNDDEDADEDKDVNEDAEFLSKIVLI